MTADTNTIRHLQQENIRLRSENNSLKDYVARLQRSLSALVTLQHNLDHITPSTDVYKLIQSILVSALDAVDSENGSLLLQDEESGELVFVEVIGDSRDALLNFRMPKGKGIVGWAVENKQVRLVEDVRKDPLFSPSADQISGLSTTSLICVPLIHENRVLGAIEAVNTRSGRAFNESDRKVMELVGKLSAMAIDAAENAMIGVTEETEAA